MFISPSVFSPSCAVWALSPKSLVAVAGHRLFLLRLPAFIPYAKVKKLILTHYILFIWKDRCMFFSDDSPQWRCQQRLPDGSPHWHFRPQLLPDAAASPLVEHLPPGGNLFRTDFRRSAPASSISATAASLASSSAAAPQPAAPPRRRLSAVALPRRPGQQQTSSGREKYSGLASNLAHLGRIC